MEMPCPSAQQTRPGKNIQVLLITQYLSRWVYCLQQDAQVRYLIFRVLVGKDYSLVCCFLPIYFADRNLPGSARLS